MAITNPRTGNTYGLAFAWQTAEGAAASIGNARYALAKSVEPSRGQSYIDPQGTAGSHFEKPTLRTVTEEPTVTAELYGSVEALPVLLEGAMLGQPTVSNAQMTRTLDGGSFITTMSLTGVRPGFNTEWLTAGACKLYISITDGSPNTVNVYKDSARSLLVATCTCADGATASLTASNNSGLTGSITLGTVTANDTDIVATIDTVAYVFASQPARFFTTFVDDGQKLHTFADCAVRRLEMTSEDKGPLMVRVEIAAKSWAQASTGATISLDHITVFAHQDSVFTTDTGGTPVVQNPMSFGLTIENSLEAVLAGSATPAKLILKSVALSARSSHEFSDEVQTMIDNDDADTEYAVSSVYTKSSRVLTVTATNMRPKDTRLPAFSERSVSPAEITWTLREAAGSSPAAPIAVTLKP